MSLLQHVFTLNIGVCLHSNCYQKKKKKKTYLNLFIHHLNTKVTRGGDKKQVFFVVEICVLKSRGCYKLKVRGYWQFQFGSYLMQLFKIK